MAVAKIASVLAMLGVSADARLRSASVLALLVVSADALKGLDYLHGAKIPGTGVGEDKTQCGRGIDDAAYRPAILHRDIRPSNIWMTWICAGGLLT